MMDALAAMAEDGVLVLANAVDLAHCKAMDERMLKDVEDLRSRPDAHYP